MTPGAAGGNVLSSTAAGGAYSRASEAIVRPVRLYHVDRDLSTTLIEKALEQPHGTDLG